MSRFLLKNKRITNGKNIWHIDAIVSRGQVQIVNLYGDVTNRPGLQAAVTNLIDSSPRYQRAA